MALIKSVPVDVPGMVVRKANGVNGFVGYILTLFIIYDGDRCYTLYNQPDWIDNQLLMQENGNCKFAFTKEVLVTPTVFPDKFNYIRQFDVSQTNSCG